MEAVEYKIMDKLEKKHAWFWAKKMFLSQICNKYLSKSDKILDVGCGTGAIVEFLQDKDYETVGVDFSEIALNYCREKGLNVFKGDANKLKFDDASFDAVVIMDVLEHLDDDVGAVGELKRILKPGGLVVATVPAHQFLFSYHDVSLHHKRRYSKEDFKKLFSNKFEVLKISWLHSMILLPTIILRKLLKNKNINKNSDVKNINSILNFFIKIAYTIEFLFFKIAGSLPFGLSLLVVARKKY